MTRVLAGDLGATKVRLGLFEIVEEGVECEVSEDFASARFEGLEEVVVPFLERAGGECSAACFGVAGPVRGRTVKITNLPWAIDADRLEDATGIPSVSLVNDLVATGWGIELLSQEDFVVLSEGEELAGGNRALVAPGTGLGQGAMVWDGRRYLPFASEGGHCDFAPSEPIEIELLRWLQGRFGHVSWERVVSGHGLVNIVLFLYARRGEETPRWLTEDSGEGQAGAAITRSARADPDGLCAEALRLFVRLLGAETGNVALKVLATGGIYLGGGIAPKIRRELETPAFLDALRAKGRMRSLVEAMPVKLILDDRTALLGAARCAALELRDPPRCDGAPG